MTKLLAEVGSIAQLRVGRLQDLHHLWHTCHYLGRKGSNESTKVKGLYVATAQNVQSVGAKRP